MKIAGLMPYRYAAKPQFGALERLRELCDVLIVFVDNVCFHDFDTLLPDELITLNPRNEDEDYLCHDYANRLLLLTRAAAHGCRWVIWADDDELIESGMCRGGIEWQIGAAEAIGEDVITYAVREMWNATQWRSDGVFATKRRVVIQKNPLLSKTVTWRDDYMNQFHSFPLQAGEEMIASTQLQHWGMSTPELRAARVAKWNKLDPEKRFQSIGYDYMASESGMTLENFKPTI